MTVPLADRTVGEFFPLVLPQQAQRQSDRLGTADVVIVAF